MRSSGAEERRKGGGKAPRGTIHMGYAEARRENEVGTNTGKAMISNRRKATMLMRVPAGSSIFIK